MYKLTRYEPELKNYGPWCGPWMMTVKCTSDDSDVDTNIFVYHAVSSETNPQGDLYDHVASLEQMFSLPIGEPVSVEGAYPTENFKPYYRKSEATLTFYNAVEMEHFWKVVKLDTAHLVAEYKAMDRLENNTTDGIEEVEI